MTSLRDAFRALRATPLVSAVAILSLALGIGANSAIFSIADSLLLRALPVREADRLVLMSSTVHSRTSSETWVSTYWTNPIWEAIRDRRQLHDGAFAYGYADFNLVSRGEVENARALRASGGMFDVLGVTPLLGRAFTTADDVRGGGPDGAVAMLSYAFWQRRFGGARDVVGRSIALDGKPVTIIGVTKPEFFGPEVGKSFDVAVPLASLSVIYGNSGLLDSRSSWWLQIMLRLPRGQSAAQAVSALRSVQREIADETRPTDQTPKDAAQHMASAIDLQPAATGSSELRKDYSRPVYALLGIVALTLLIACGNIANLLLARGNARRH